MAKYLKKTFVRLSSLASYVANSDRRYWIETLNIFGLKDFKLAKKKFNTAPLIDFYILFLSSFSLLFVFQNLKWFHFVGWPLSALLNTNTKICIQMKKNDWTVQMGRPTLTEREDWRKGRRETFYLILLHSFNHLFIVCFSFS